MFLKINKKKALSLFFLIALALIVVLRFYRVGDFFSFNFDEEYQASLAWEQIKNFHPIWIGVSASNLNYYLGPGLVYLEALLFYFSHGDPIILGWFSALLGVLVTFLIYYVGKDVFSKRIGMIASIIYGGSALMNFFDRRFWNPGFIPIISLLIFYSLVKFKKNTKWLILTAFLLGVSFHIHLSLMLFLPIILWVVVKNIKKIKKITLAKSVLVYLIATSPLIVFDFVHNFSNLLAPFNYFLKGKGEQTAITLASISSHFKVFLSSLGRYWFLSLNTNLQNEQGLGQHVSITPAKPFLILISGIMILFLLTRLKRFNYKMLAATSFVFPLTFIFYPGYSAEYYLLGFFVLFPFIIAILLEKLNKYLVCFLLSIFLILNSITILRSNQNIYGLTTRKTLIKKITKKLNGSSYSLETYGKNPRKYHPYGGWRYLFKTYGYRPNNSFADEFFGWIYPDEISRKLGDYRVVISDSIIYKNKQRPIAKFKKGSFYGYIFKN